MSLILSTPTAASFPSATPAARPPSSRVRPASPRRGAEFVQAFCRALGLPTHCVREGALEFRWQDRLDVTVCATPWDQVSVMALLGPADGLTASQWLALITQTSDLSPWPWAGQLLVHDGQLWLNWAAPADLPLADAVDHALSFLGTADDAQALLGA